MKSVSRKVLTDRISFGLMECQIWFYTFYCLDWQIFLLSLKMTDKSQNYSTSLHDHRSHGTIIIFLERPVHSRQKMFIKQFSRILERTWIRFNEISLNSMRESLYFAAQNDPCLFLFIVSPKWSLLLPVYCNSSKVSCAIPSNPSSDTSSTMADVWSKSILLSGSTQPLQKIEIIIHKISWEMTTVYRVFRVGKFWRKWRLERCVKFHWVLFWLFQGLSMKTYNRVYFSLCLFLTISGKSRTRQKLNPREKFLIYSINAETNLVISPHSSMVKAVMCVGGGGGTLISKSIVSWNQLIFSRLFCRL